MPAYLVLIPQSLPGMNLPHGHDCFAVFAADAADAKAIAASRFAGDADVLLQSSQMTVTEVAADADLTGWTARVIVSNVSTDAVVADVTHTGVASDTFDIVGAALVVLLNATASIANASYTANVLTVASIADGLGDHNLVCEFRPPASEHDGPAAVPGMVGAIVDEGIAAAVLTAAFAADAYVIPKFHGSFKQ